MKSFGLNHIIVLNILILDNTHNRYTIYIVGKFVKINHNPEASSLCSLI